MKLKIKKEIAMKRIRTKLKTKTKWNQMSKDEIENLNQLQKALKAKQIAIKKKEKQNWDK